MGGKVSKDIGDFREQQRGTDGAKKKKKIDIWRSLLPKQGSRNRIARLEQEFNTAVKLIEANKQAFLDCNKYEDDNIYENQCENAWIAYGIAVGAYDRKDRNRAQKITNYENSIQPILQWSKAPKTFLKGKNKEGDKSDFSNKIYNYDIIIIKKFNN